jgi:2-aminoethylphosphonate-pyruvate transaminase
VIYPGKLSKFPTFRLGNIGELYESDIYELVEKFKEAFEFMQVPLPLPKQ